MTSEKESKGSTPNGEQQTQHEPPASPLAVDLSSDPVAVRLGLADANSNPQNPPSSGLSKPSGTTVSPKLTSSNIARSNPLGLSYNNGLPGELFDAGRRASDRLNEAIAHHGWWTIRNQWMAFKLSDGSSDGQLYDTKREAVRHQSSERECCYVCFRSLAQGARWRDMAIFIKFNRDLYDKGYRMPDPDDVHGGPQPAVTTAWNDFYNGQLFMPRLTAQDLERLRHGR